MAINVALDKFCNLNHDPKALLEDMSQLIIDNMTRRGSLIRSGW